MLVFLHKMVLTENEATLLCVTMRERERAFAVSIYCTNIDIFIKTCSFCGSLFKCMEWKQNISKK